MPLSSARGLAPLVALTVLLSGCGVFGSSSDNASRSSKTPEPSPIESTQADAGSADAPSLARYYRQKLSWKPCQDKDQCARMRVPLDYSKPAGRSVSISLLKVPAQSKARRLGSMVVNPGGPGGSGIEYAAGAENVFGQSLRDVFDVVGFDPRGVGKSTPVECASRRQLDTLVSSDPDPDTRAEITYSDGLLRKLGKGCLRTSGDLARHVSTVEVAKDLDILRAALGDSKLTYFGASYGTSIGATYADLFPTKVGRMVLDGALDPALSTLELNLVQARGFEVALRAYVGACVDRGNCFLGSSVDQGTRRVRAFLDTVEKKPLTTKAGEKVTAGLAVYGIWYPLYDKGSWPILDKALTDAFSGDASLLLTVANAYLHRDADGRYQDNSLQAFYAISCLDRDDGLPSAQVQKYAPRFEKASPTFGSIFAYSTSGCRTWPIHSGRLPKRVHATGSPPILVVGTTRDPATPLVWAKALAKQLDKGLLVTRDGDGHTGYRRGSTCVDRTVEAYLVAGKAPKASVTCH